MHSSKTDRRAERTQERLLDALVSLLMERGYERLTIQNLLDRAGVGRATFYAHFQNKEDLLSRSIGRLHSSLVDEWKRGAGNRGMPAVRLSFTLPFFQHLESHRRLYHTTIGHENEPTVERRIEHMLTDLVREDLGRHYRGKAKTAVFELAVRYVVRSLWATVVWWAGSKKPMPPEEINQIFQRITFPGIDAVFAMPAAQIDQGRS